MTSSTHPHTGPADRYATRIAARLAAGEQDIGHDIAERLRIARQQAVAARRVDPLPRAVAVPVALPQTAAVGPQGGETPGWWTGIASLVPLLMLVGGLIAIDMVRSEQRARELADVDTQLLADDLPPAAYADPGFVQFLRAGGDAAPR